MSLLPSTSLVLPCDTLRSPSGDGCKTCSAKTKDPCTQIYFKISYCTVTKDAEANMAEIEVMLSHCPGLVLDF